MLYRFGNSDAIFSHNNGPPSVKWDLQGTVAEEKERRKKNACGCALLVLPGFVGDFHPRNVIT